MTEALSNGLLMKSALKWIARSVCLVLVFPQVAAYRLAALLVGNERAFPGTAQLFSLIPGLLGVYLRHAGFRQILPECGEDAWIGFGVQLTHPDTRIGPNAYLGTYAVLGRVTIERDVLIGSFVSIMNGNQQHGIERLDIPVREQPGTWPHVTIGEDSWIGDHAVVMADVGKHCVVAAGAVVTSPVPDYAIVAGCPARVLRYRTSGDETVCSTTESPAPPRYVV